MKISAIMLSVLLLISVICIANVPTKEITKDKVLSAGSEWQGNYDSYNPDPNRITELKSKLGENLRVDVYLGLWCPDSQNNVPPFIKILDSTGIAVPVRFFSVQRKPVKSIKYYADNLQVERIPTFIFYRGDEEIGRIVENPKAGMIEDTIEILSK